MRIYDRQKANQETESAPENLHHMRTTVYLAEEMERCVG